MVCSRHDFGSDFGAETTCLQEDTQAEVEGCFEAEAEGVFCRPTRWELGGDTEAPHVDPAREEVVGLLQKFENPRVERLRALCEPPETNV